MKESGEMYLETIRVLSDKRANVRAIDISEEMGYSKPSVSRALGILKNDGYISVNENGYISLTETGSSLANKIYERCGCKIIVPIEIAKKLDKEVEEDVYKYAKEAFRALNLSGVTRFDFLIDTKKKQVYVNEPNTIPGCLAFFFYTPKDKSYTQLLDELITTSIKEYKDSKKKVTSFESNVLSTYDGSGSKNKMQ